MINNYICESCDHLLVCEINKKRIMVFSDDLKAPLGLDITINKCKNYKEVE